MDTHRCVYTHAHTIDKLIAQLMSHSNTWKTFITWSLLKVLKLKSYRSISKLGPIAFCLSVLWQNVTYPLAKREVLDQIS